MLNATTPQTTPPARRLTSLDAVRGIAFFVFILSHCYLTIPDAPRSAFEGSLWSRPLRLLHNGNAAVIIFFVLSGYVLALPFFRGTQPSYPRYLLKRFCRIYIPFAAAILVAACLYCLASRQIAPNASEWFNGVWPWKKPRLSTLAGHLLMIGTRRDMNLDIVMWSLVYEMRISLIFPLLVALCRNTRQALFASFLMLAISTKILTVVGDNNHPSNISNFWITLLWTMKLVPSFVTGILLNKHRARIQSILQRVPTIIRAILFTVAVIIIFCVNQLPTVKRDILYDVGAALVILAAIEMPRLNVFLNSRIPQWLGRISYSVYLIHLPIFLVMFPLLLERLPFVVAAVAVIASSLIAATVMHILIEAPAIRLGQRLARPLVPTIADATASATSVNFP
jgi:peptidoglycan/LPS O-acetylase OafA/YrhL